MSLSSTGCLIQLLVIKTPSFLAVFCVCCFNCKELLLTSPQHIILSLMGKWRLSTGAWRLIYAACVQINRPSGILSCFLLSGQPTPIHLPYLPGESAIVLLDRTLTKTENMIKLLHFHLLRAQNRMAQLADKHKSERRFNIGDYVYLKLQPYEQSTVSKSHFNKLHLKFFRPFPIIDKVGEVAYKLQLPSDAAIHNVFYVSQLKKCYDHTTATTFPLPTTPYSSAVKKFLEAILDRKMVKRGRVAATKVLVKWKNLLVEAVAWEFYFDLL